MIFFDPGASHDDPVLSEEESQHCIRVLRHKKGDQIDVLDGKGGRYKAIIEEDHPKRCRYRIIEHISVKPDPYHLHLAIAPTKNSERMEWMVEKCVEIGLHELTFLQCTHSERNKLRLDRLQKKAVAAMKQSGRAWQTHLHEMVPFEKFVRNCPPETIRHLAYVPASGTSAHLKHTKSGSKYIVMVGPEGDFSPEEVSKALLHGFIPTSLGNSRLRTETAGIVVCHTLSLIHS